MNKYVEHIEELLYLHDCVIVPGFGGFICDYTSASINEKTGIIVPPSKKVVFNKYLKQNDGLLIDWIARKEQVDYEKAQRRLALFCEEVKVRLNQKQKVDFGTIGTFSVDRRFNILFESKNHNFLPDVIGMETLPLVTVNGKKARKTQEEVINTESGNLVTRLFKFGLSAAVVTGIVVISQQAIFQGDGVTNMTNMQPSPIKNKTILVENPAVISPTYDFVDYDPIIDLPEPSVSRQAQSSKPERQ